MMTREEVLQAAAAKPNGFGLWLADRTLLWPEDLTGEMRKSLPESWIPLSEASNGKEFYNELIDLWYRGCGSDAYSPVFLEKQLRCAAFFPVNPSEVGICYITESSGNNSSLLCTQGNFPVETSVLEEWPDYGPLTSFCKQVHCSIEAEEEFVRHPSWKIEIPQFDLVRKMETWAEFYADALEDFEMPITFTEDKTDRTDDPRFRPDLATTIQFGKSVSYNFVEPGDPVGFWSFWTNDAEMQLRRSYVREPTINLVDENLAYLLGY